MSFVYVYIERKIVLTFIIKRRQTSSTIIGLLYSWILLGASILVLFLLPLHIGLLVYIQYIDNFIFAPATVNRLAEARTHIFNTDF